MRKRFVAAGLILLGVVGVLIAVLMSDGDAPSGGPAETTVEAPEDRPVRTRAPRKRTVHPTTEPEAAVVDPQPAATQHEVIAAEDASGTLTVFGPDGTTPVPPIASCPEESVTGPRRCTSSTSHVSGSFPHSPIITAIPVPCPRPVLASEP